MSVTFLNQQDFEQLLDFTQDMQKIIEKKYIDISRQIQNVFRDLNRVCVISQSKDINQFLKEMEDYVWTMGNNPQKLSTFKLGNIGDSLDKFIDIFFDKIWKFYWQIYGKAPDDYVLIQSSTNYLKQKEIFEFVLANLMLVQNARNIPRYKRKFSR